MIRSLLPNALLIARREYLARIRSRAFLVSTGIIALVAFAVGLSPVAIRFLDHDTQAHVAIYVAAQDLKFDPVASADVVLNAGAASVLTGNSSTGSRATRAYDITRVTDLAAAEADVKRGRLLGVLVIDRDPTGKLTFDYDANISPVGRQATLMNITAFWIGLQDALSRTGETTNDIYGHFKVAPTEPVSGQGPPTEVQAVTQTILATVLIILIFITVMTYGMWIAASVAEEKNSRVMELILSAATPGQMLTGKVMGVGAAGLTQYGGVLVMGLGAVALQGPLARVLLGDAADSGPSLTGLTPGLLVLFGLFFMAGFALYAFLYAAAGSLVSRQEDVQQVAMPMIALSMAGYFLASIAVTGIESSWVVPLSFVPFFAPFLMLVRVILSSVTPLELAVSFGLLLGSIALSSWLAARVYRAGVLLYGQRPGLRAFLWAARTPR